MNRDAINQYLKTIDREIRAGNATEHTHRSTLKTLLETLGGELLGVLTVTNEPKRIACGSPDFLLARGGVPLGHVETKDVGVNLAEIERGKGPHGDQFIRYRDGLPNWILTDYLEFHWFVAGERRLTATLAQVDEKGKIRALPDGQESLLHLFDAFLKLQAPMVGTARELAQRLAGTTRMIRDVFLSAFKDENEKGWLHTWLAAFQETLIPDLGLSDFADMFAQTIAYGLFASKVHSGAGKTFTREVAAYNLPKTNPFLRKLFAEIAGVDMPEEMAWAVDEIVALLQHAEMGKILEDFGKGEGKQDPVVHFYETFLAAYDPGIRELRGVYYTPEAVVSYIVRSADQLLRTHFSRPKGLADESTLVLDPATGTATFLYFAVRQIYEGFLRQRGAWDGPEGYVAQHLLNRLFGFELLMAPYAVAHLKMGVELEQTGYTFSSDQRLGIYLTNTLEEAAKKSENLFGKWISDEADAAAAIKRDKPIMVVLGNPPYSGHSANRSWEIKNGKRQVTFIGRLIQDYFRVDGKPLGERNPKWLQDDYVKFLRWGQWRIERTGQGILAFITNHGYLDNPTFRGMRQQLMEAFDEIYVLDLHGNSKKKERAPDGSKDENVFDIQQGVAIGIFVKHDRSAAVPAAFAGKMPALQKTAVSAALEKKNAGETPALRGVYHAELWGARQAKYDTLFANDVATTKWRKLRPDAPFYLFVPQDTGLREEYQRGWKLTDAMPVNVLGFQTHRDDFAVDFEESQIRARINQLRDISISDDDLRQLYHLQDNRDWQVVAARKQAREDIDWEKHIVKCLYRPFDWRWCYFSTVAMDYPRRELLQHVSGRFNLCMNVVRQTKKGSWGHALVSNIPTPALYVELKDGSNVFPLYLYPARSVSQAQGELNVNLSNLSSGHDGRTPNLNPEFIADLEKRLGLRSAAVPAALEKENAGKTPALQDPAVPAAFAGRMPALQSSAQALTIRSRGRLPHWERESAIYFVTFRLADSLPQSALESIEFERKDIVATAKQQGRDLTPAEQDRLDKLFSDRIEQYLDSGEGACYLAQQEIADIVAEALRHFDGERYYLLEWCIMPNHVHVIFQLFSGRALPDILHSWKSFTAKQANKVLKKGGEFWQREYYDHLVRDEQDLARIAQYVAENPAKAQLTNWPWVWSRSAAVRAAFIEAGETPALQDAGATILRSAAILAATEKKNASETQALQPEDVFHYFYAILHSPSYRQRYAEFLKTDFPRIPLTSNPTLFWNLCGKGKALVELHLMESPALAGLITRYAQEGANLIEKGFPTYHPPGELDAATAQPISEGRVYVNSKQYFEGVPPEIWEFHIGGYQVCEKWLKDRRGRTLSYDDLQHYQKVILSLKETTQLMVQIDAAIDANGGWPLV